MGPNILLTACQSNPADKQFLSPDDVTLLDEIGETIIPATVSSPGAKSANIGSFMKVYVADCYNKADQEVFRSGLIQLNDLSKSKHGNQFVYLNASQQRDLLVQLDREAKEHNRNRERNTSTHYFSMIKEMTVFGYYTSKPGATKALRYLPVPGSYNGDQTNHKGDKAWAM